jgi:Xaa-Pro aminopeptidase
MDIFHLRRRALAQKAYGSAIIISAPSESKYGSVANKFRQDSNLYYLTGFEEPETILLFRPGMTPETVLFTRKKDREKETWDGFRYGPEGAEKFFKVDKAYTIDEFEARTVPLLKGTDRLYYRMFRDPQMDKRVQKVIEDHRTNQGRTGYGILPIFDTEELIGELRIIKSEDEIEVMRTACRISAEAHVAAMRATRAGMNESDLHNIITFEMNKRGASREGYNTIVAGGNNATTLHYVYNDCPLKSGELLLIDAGAEYNYYTGDITRTFPINGKFTDEQALVYEGVLKVQKTILNYLKPGIVFKELHEMATSLLTDLMLDLGLLNGRKSDIIDALEHKKYYPHGVGHWLGMDVHDVGMYLIKDQPRPVQANMCFTVEPGLYIPEDDTSAPSKFRGIGIRIEDDIRITQNGCEILTTAAPKEIPDLEAIIGKLYTSNRSALDHSI